MKPRRPGGGGIFPRFSVREDVERELESHVAFRTEELMAEGWERAAAEAEARRLFGDRAVLARECVGIVRSQERAERRATTVDGLMQDLEYGARTILRNPGFALVAVVTLALGIGANTAIFSVVHGVLLEPLPFEEPEELVAVWETRPQGGTMSVAWANFVDWHGQASSFEGIFAHGTQSTTILGGDQPVIAQVAAVTVDAWSTLGAVPSTGRLPGPSDHTLGAPPVAIVSEGFWRSALASRPLPELRIEANGLSAAVVGVVPDDFDFPVGTEVWLPAELYEQGDSRSSHNWSVVGRLGDGVPLERAAEEMNTLTVRLVGSASDDDPDYLAVGATLVPLREQIVGDARTPLIMLLGAAGLVLLVACTNLASTLLARGTNRQRELGVRASLGASNRRIVRQLVTESVVLAALGAVAGLAVGGALVGVLQRLGPDSIPRLDEIGIDPSVLVFTGVTAAATVLLFGLLPAVRLTRGLMADSMRTGSRGNADGARGGIWVALVGSEVALALVLLVGSGLLIRSFRSLLAEDPGIDVEDVMTLRMALSRVKYDTPQAQVDWYRQALSEVEGTPGVAGAGLMSSTPLAGSVPNGRMELDGDLDKHADAGYVVVSGGAFDALDIPLLAGRTFDERDTPDQPHVAIVSQSFVDRFWPGENAIGRSVTGGGMDNFYLERTFAEVVGVVGDVRYRQLGSPPVPVVYFPYTQRPQRIQYAATVLVESGDGNAESVVGALRSIVQRLEPDVPLRLASQESLVGDSVAAREFTMLLLTGFSLVALLLAVVGIYGVVSYSVARRTREMGIRLALGADPSAVLRMVMGASLRMVAGGLILGSIGAVLVGRLMRGLLYGVAPTDPVAVLAGVVLLASAAALASWLPARVSTRVDPLVTMRAE